MIRCLIKLLGQKSQIQIKASVHCLNIGDYEIFCTFEKIFPFI